MSRATCPVPGPQGPAGLRQGWGAPDPPPCSPQLAMEALEQEQQSLRVQIARVLEDRQQLMHLKMSLSLEVATYR